MQCREFSGINSFLVGMAKDLLRNGVERQTRGCKCFELPYPVIIKINNPLSRIVTIPERGWNYILPYVESLSLAAGRNDMKIMGFYVKKLYDFSDDKEFMRAGYGPRMRFFNGIADDYKIGYDPQPQNSSNKRIIKVDQFEFVEKSFVKDSYTRQGIISITDPAKDYFLDQHQLKVTKDFPCTGNIQFLRNGNQVDMIVNMRSNDFLWGASGVNIFNFTFMQEYFAKILGLKVGLYYHIVNNLHYYNEFRSKLEALASIDNIVDEAYPYCMSFSNLSEFDEKIHALENYEKALREEGIKEVRDFGDEFFNDWGKVFYTYYYKDNNIQFSNPSLNLVAKRKMDKDLVKQ